MKLRAKTKSSVDFPIVKDAEGQAVFPALHVGEDGVDVSEDHLEALGKRHNTAWLEAMFETHLELLDDDGEVVNVGKVDDYRPGRDDDDPEDGDTPDPDANDDGKISAAEAIDAAKACKTLEALEEVTELLGADESRVTVLASVDKRREELQAALNAE